MKEEEKVEKVEEEVVEEVEEGWEGGEGEERGEQMKKKEKDLKYQHPAPGPPRASRHRQGVAPLPLSATASLASLLLKITD